LQTGKLLAIVRRSNCWKTVKPMDEDPNLGPVEPWQIKQFPRRLRLELTEQAGRKR